MLLGLPSCDREAGVLLRCAWDLGLESGIVVGWAVQMWTDPVFFSCQEFREGLHLFCSFCSGPALWSWLLCGPWQFPPLLVCGGRFGQGCEGGLVVGTNTFLNRSTDVCLKLLGSNPVGIVKVVPASQPFGRLRLGIAVLTIRRHKVQFQ